MSWWKYKRDYVYRWREPYRFTRYLCKESEKRTKWWSRPLQVVIISVILFPIWAFALRKSSDPFTAFLLSLFFGVFTVYFSSFVHYIATREIRICEGAIVSGHGNNIEGWNYDHIKYIQFTTLQIGRRDYLVMHVVMLGPVELITAIPEKVDIMKIIDFLENKGVNILPKPAEPS